MNNRLKEKKGAMSIGSCGHKLKKRIKWKYFLEENNKLVQFKIDHPEYRIPEYRLEQ
jgi:hypothetical protein